MIEESYILLKYGTYKHAHDAWESETTELEEYNILGEFFTSMTLRNRLKLVYPHSPRQQLKIYFAG